MKLVKRKPGHKVFKFGGNEIKKSIEVVEIPCILAGKWIRLSADVVDSNIPLLLSKESMKRLKVKLDLENDVAEIFGVSQNLDCTSSGHYLIPLYDHDPSRQLLVQSQKKRCSNDIKSHEKTAVTAVFHGF